VSVLSKSKCLSTRSVERVINSFAILQGSAGSPFAVVVIALALVSVSIVIVPGANGIFGAALALLMLTIAVIDWRHFIIPNGLTALGFTLALGHAAAQEPDAVFGAVMIAATRAAAAALAFLIFRNVYARIRGRQGLGLGDVKLAGVAGAWLDWSMIPLAIELAALVALSAYIFRQFVLGRPLRATNRLPFGFFFAPAIWVSWLLDATFLAP
jgi:leader peptidase (prepilin peptidase) / N-methyltransferase